MSIFVNSGVVEIRYKFCWFVSIVFIMTIFMNANGSSMVDTSHMIHKAKYETSLSITEEERARCGVDDLPSFKTKRFKRYSVSRGWDHRKVTWSFRPKRTPLRSRNARKLNPKRVRAVLRRALSIWSKNADVSFKEIDSDKADILVSFGGDDFDKPTPGVVDLAYAYEPGPGRGGDVHFNENVRWTLDMESNKRGTFRLFDVAVHEFGHSLGLLHSHASHSIMNAEFRYTLNPPEYKLPQDDLDAIQKLSTGQPETQVPIMKIAREYIVKGSNLCRQWLA